jgi:hypothetical protein
MEQLDFTFSECNVQMPLTFQPRLLERGDHELSHHAIPTHPAKVERTDDERRWHPIRDLAGYKVYFGLASQTYGPPIDVGNQTTYTLSGLTDGIQYYIAVTAYDTSRRESAFSNEVRFSNSLVANFTATPTSGTTPLAVGFTDTSIGPIMVLRWRVGRRRGRYRGRVGSCALVGTACGGEYFQGLIDEVRLYNHALSANQIQADMSEAIGATTDGALRVQNLRAPLKLGNILSALAR